MLDERKVTGVRETIATLRKVDRKVAAKSIAKIKAPASSTARSLQGTVPAAPLSGMAGEGPVRVSVKYGGRQSQMTGVWPLVRISLRAPRWAVASDMARNSGAGETMTHNLNAKYPRASRWAYPKVEARLSTIVQGIRAAIRDVEKEMNRLLKKG